MSTTSVCSYCNLHAHTIGVYEIATLSGAEAADRAPLAAWRRPWKLALAVWSELVVLQTWASSMCRLNPSAVGGRLITGGPRCRSTTLTVRRLRSLSIGFRPRCRCYCLVSAPGTGVVCRKRRLRRSQKPPFDPTSRPFLKRSQGFTGARDPLAVQATLALLRRGECGRPEFDPVSDLTPAFRTRHTRVAGYGRRFPRSAPADRPCASGLAQVEWPTSRIRATSMNGRTRNWPSCRVGASSLLADRLAKPRTRLHFSHT